MNVTATIPMPELKPIVDAPLRLIHELTTVGAQSSLHAYAVLRAAQEALGQALEQLKPAANLEFKSLINNEPLRKEFDVLDMLGVKLATVLKYTPKAIWQYSPAVLKLAEELKAAQAREQTDKTAVKQASTSDTTFSIRLT